MQNMTGFLWRLCGLDLQTGAPWTVEALLARYQRLHIVCRSLITVHAHSHWINLLVQCPEFGHPGSGRALVAPVSRA